jgi:uncharacterized protein YgbK (DUF1537 family)
MIAAVIADDLTGAAELATAAADMGFSAEVHTVFDPASDADIICLDTDTRSLSPQDGSEVVTRVSRDVLRAKPSWFFKKTDSVLRGNVRAEIEAVLRVTGLRRALLVPANPSKDRIIRDGVYYVHGVPLDQTAFSTDRDHPRTSKDVRELLGPSIGPEDVELPDLKNLEDVRSHAGAADESTLAAGGVDFFRAVLDVRGGARMAPPVRETILPPVLLCCGSLQAWCAGRAGHCDEHGIPVILPGDNLTVEPWAERVIKAVVAGGIAMTAIGKKNPLRPEHLTDSLAKMIVRVLERQKISTLCLEGGATAGAVLKALNVNRLTAVASTLPGVAALRSAMTPSLLLKPGSYPWPEPFWHGLRGAR